MPEPKDIAEVIARMEAGEPLRWVSKSMQGMKHDINSRDLCLGGDVIFSEELTFQILACDRIRDAPEYDPHNRRHVIDLELVD